MGQDVSKVRAARNTAQALAESCRDDAKGGYRWVSGKIVCLTHYSPDIRIL